MIKLKRPVKEYEREALAFRQEFTDNGEDTINGSELLDRIDSYDEWLKSVTDNISAETVNPSWVVKFMSEIYDPDKSALVIECEIGIRDDPGRIDGLF